ncbi:MAG: beta-lactamase family protein [Phycisphaerales bacterium]|nr:beta-lactamase family protein [Phycisphaerales bacterium]
MSSKSVHRQVAASLLAIGGMCVSMSPAQPAIEPAVAPSSSSSPTATAVRDCSSKLESIREKHKAPALAGAVVTADRLEILGASGIRSVGHNEAITPQDKFHIGSCTKAMTATLIAILVEKGTLKWETTLPEALPDLKDSIHEKYRDVTIADLLTQRSGVTADMQKDGLFMSLFKADADMQALRHQATKTMLSWEPSHDRSKFVYANGNFLIAGHIAEVATGKTWEDLMRSLLFEPLGMTSAGFGAPGGDAVIDQPRGHHPSAGAGVRFDNPAAIGPAGTVHATLEDWGKFISLHLRGAKADQKVGDVTITTQTFMKLHEPIKGNGADYAMGWGIGQRPWAKGPAGDTTVWSHSGSNTLWFCVVWAAPDAGFAVLAASNIGGDGAAKACDDVCDALIRDHLGQKK